MFDVVASNPLIQEASSLRVSMQSTNKLSEDASIEITVPQEMTLSSECNPVVITLATVRSGITCEILPDENKIVFTDLFYSFGYDPQLDKVITINITDAITRNPSSLMSNLNFTARTLEIN